jgi:hypothetical protein
METHVPRKLDTKMPKATNPLHTDQISAAQAGVTKGVVGRNARTKEWSSLHGSEFIRNGCDAARFSDHHFGISSIDGYSRIHGVLTVHHVSASARLAHSVLAAKEADTDPLTDFPFGDSASQGFDAPNCFMPWNARENQARESARNRG